MRKIYTILFTLFCFITLQAQTFEFSLEYVGVNSSTNNYQVAFMATPSASVTNGVTADLGGGFYVPNGSTIGNFVQGDSGLPASEWSLISLESDAYFVARAETGGNSVILNGGGPFQLVLFDIIADPNPTSGQVIFVENGDPVFEPLFLENYIEINLGSGTSNAYSKNNPAANSVDFSTLSNKAFELSEINIYPNPASEKINIQTSKLYKSINVYSILGEHIETSFEKEIDVSNYKSGIYFLNIELEQGFITKKLIIN